VLRVRSTSARPHRSIVCTSQLSGWRGCLPDCLYGVTRLRGACGFASLRSVGVCSCGTLCFRELRAHFHGILHMILQRCPAILHTTTIRRATRQLHQILVKPLLLYLLQFLLPLLRSRSALQALALYLGLTCLDGALCADIIKRISQRFEVRDKLLIGAATLGGLGGGLLDLRDKGRVFDLLLVFLRRGEGRIVVE
jgi:hypothetical protein